MSYSCNDAYSDITQALNLTTPAEWDLDGADHVSEETDLALAEIERLQKQTAITKDLADSLNALLGAIYVDFEAGGRYAVSPNTHDMRELIKTARAAVLKASGL